MLPKDPYILLSAINMKLRDFPYSLQELCSEEDSSQEEVLEKLRAIGYVFDETQQRFIPQ